MYDACYHHPTCDANNSCLQLLKDILLTLSPAELDWLNSWRWMETITPVFKILFKCLSVSVKRVDLASLFVLRSVKCVKIITSYLLSPP